MSYTSKRIEYISRIKPIQNYLEIGVYKGSTFENLNFSNMVAVDPNFQYDYKKNENINKTYIEKTSDSFFETNAQYFDFVFIDGLHTFEQALSDLLNSISFLNKGGLILIDDTVPCDIYSSLKNSISARKHREAETNSLDKSWHGDVYKLIPFIRDYLTTFEYFTFDDYDLNRQTLIYRSKTNRSSEKRPLDYYDKYSYFDMKENYFDYKFLSATDIYDIVSRSS